mmetsp:Transcript_38112/g.89567  ORF Transcript_38112/g.89567 Transcript_38112/m.89567 type:complete len:353 (-) Transcript_38112:60-1118(-)
MSPLYPTSLKGSCLSTPVTSAHSASVPAPPNGPRPTASNATTSESSGRAAEATDESVPANVTPGHTRSSRSPNASSCPTASPNSFSSSRLAALSTVPPSCGLSRAQGLAPGSASARAREKAVTSRSEFSHANAKAGVRQALPAGETRSASSPRGGAYAPGKKGEPAPSPQVIAILKQKGAPARGPSTTSPPVERVAALIARTSCAHSCARTKSGRPSALQCIITLAKSRLVEVMACTSKPRTRLLSTCPREAITETPPPSATSSAASRASSARSCASAAAGSDAAHCSNPLVARRAICRSTSCARSSAMAARKKLAASSTPLVTSSKLLALMKYVTARTFISHDFAARDLSP